MQHTTSNNHSQPIAPKPLASKQADFAKAVVNGRDLIYLGISKTVFTLRKLDQANI